MTTALLHDHNKRLAKPRTCYIVLEFNRQDGKYLGIAIVQSNESKAQMWIHENGKDGISYVVHKERVL